MRKIKNLVCLLFLISIPSALVAQDLEELRSFANKFSKAVVDEENNYLKTVLHKPTFADRILIRGTSEGIRGFNDGFTEGLNEDFLLQKIILANLTTGLGTYDVIRVYFDGEDAHAVFRVNDAEVFDYHDLLLKKFGNEYKIVDIYSYLTGEYASQTFQRLYLTIAKDLFSSAKTAELPDISMKEMLKMVSIKQLVDQGNYQSARQGMNKLKAETKKEKMFRLFELIIAGNSGDKAYLEALTRYHRDYPNDPSVYMTSVDYLVLRKEFGAAQAAIDKLDELVGGDSFLDLLRGSTYYQQGDFKNAVAKYRAFTSSYSSVIAGWDGLLSAYVDLNQFGDAVTALDGMLDNFFFIGRKTLADSMEEEPFYTQLVKSKAFKDWKNDKKK